jgi:hypothetical protein
MKARRSAACRVRERTMMYAEMPVVRGLFLSSRVLWDHLRTSASLLAPGAGAISSVYSVVIQRLFCQNSVRYPFRYPSPLDAAITWPAIRIQIDPAKN